MRRAVVRCVLAVTLVVMVGVGSASAQRDLRVQVEGLQPGTDVAVVLAFANLNKSEPAVAAGGGGSLDFISDFANLGKTPSEAETPTQVYVYYDRCEDPDQILFSDTPRDDEECRDAIGIFFISSRTTGVVIDVTTGTITPLDDDPPPGEGGPRFGGRFNIGGGIQNVENTSASDRGLSPMQPGFTGPVGSIDTNEWSGNFFAEFFPIRWVGGGYGYQSAGATTLGEVFTAEPPFDDITVTVDGFFDPSVHNVYGALQLPFGRVRPFVHGGGAYFDADSGNTAVFRQGSAELDRQSSNQTNSGWGPYFSAGVDIFATSWLGLRTGVVYEQLKDDSVGESEGDVDEDLLKLILNVVMSF